MPTYVYFCDTCDTEFEAFQPFSAKPLKTHDVCGGGVRKVFLPASIVFKGSGFYITDSRSSSRATSAPAKSNSNSGSKADSKADAKATTSTDE